MRWTAGKGALGQRPLRESNVLGTQSKRPQSPDRWPHVESQQGQWFECMLSVSKVLSPSARLGPSCPVSPSPVPLPETKMLERKLIDRRVVVSKSQTFARSSSLSQPQRGQAERKCDVDLGGRWRRREAAASDGLDPALTAPDPRSPECYMHPPLPPRHRILPQSRCSESSSQTAAPVLPIVPSLSKPSLGAPKSPCTAGTGTRTGTGTWRPDHQTRTRARPDQSHTDRHPHVRCSRLAGWSRTGLAHLFLHEILPLRANLDTSAQRSAARKLRHGQLGGLHSRLVFSPSLIPLSSVPDLYHPRPRQSRERSGRARPSR